MNYYANSFTKTIMNVWKGKWELIGVGRRKITRTIEIKTQNQFEKEMQQTLQNFDIRLPVDVSSSLNSNNLQTDFIKKSNKG